VSAVSYPYARTFDEAYLYMELRPCVCGEPEFDKTTASVIEDGVPVERYSGHCPTCGRARQFTFRMPDEPPRITLDMVYGWGDEPSRLLDPGEWLGVADVFAANARAELDGAGSPDADSADEERLTRIFYQLSAAIAATGEAVKFLPSGADRIPEEAFRSQPGRLRFELSPERFQRARLEAELADRKRLLADFEERYGTDEAEAR
jgi:hypothetical protein